MRRKASDLARRTTYPPPPTPHRPALLLKNLRNTNVDHAEYTEGRWSRPVAIAYAIGPMMSPSQG